MSPTATPKTSTASLFDVTEFTRRTVESQIEMVPLGELELASNPRKQIDRTGIERLARMLASMGQLVPLIGQRVAEERVLIWDGQRRVLAARASHALAGTDDFEGLKEVRALIVVLLDHEPTADEIRRIQAQANAREDLTRRDQQEQFRDCWEARAGLPDEDRMAIVCDDLGIAPQKGHHLRREIDLPDAIRGRVSEKPTGDAISVKMAGRLAAMHRAAPELTDAVAARITSRDLHDRAQQDMGAFVHRTVIEDETVYAVRIEDGAMLDAHKQLEDARRHLTAGHIQQLVAVLGCTKPDEVERKLDELATKARAKALKLRIDAHLRDRVANGNFAFRHDRGTDLAPSLWIIDPVFTIGLVAEQVTNADDRMAREESFFGGSNVRDDEVAGAAEAEHARREAERRRQAEAAAMNTGLGHDIRAGLMDPTEDQLHALRALVCHLLVAHHPELIAYGAGWTDRANMRPVGDTARFEPQSIDAVVANELRRALEDKDALRGIAQLAARLGAAFVLDPAGVTRTKALGAERMSNKIRDALPGGEHPLRDAVWAFMRPMMSPHLVALNQDAFVIDEGVASTVDLAAHRGDSALDDLDLGDDEDTLDAAA